MADLARQCSEDAAARVESGLDDPDDDDDDDDEDGGRCLSA